MLGIMTFIKGYWKRCNSHELTVEQRTFAVLEAICKPISFLVLGGIPVLGILRWQGLAIPEWIVVYAMPILLSAAIGYLTNWIAIEMLFRPYETTLRHPFAVLTFGYWRQGLIPKNKEAIADKIATTAEQELIRPKELAEDICGMVGELMENKTVLSSIRSMMQTRLLEHAKEISDYLAPKIEAEVMAEMRRLFTTDNVKAFWCSQIEPFLKSDETKERLADIVADFIAKHSSDLAEEIRPALVQLLQEYCEEKGGIILGKYLYMAADYLTSGILSKETLANGIKNWVEKPETLPAIRGKVALALESCREYVLSPGNDDAIGKFVNRLFQEFKGYIHNTLSTRLHAGIIQLANSEELWNDLMNQIPKCKPNLEKYVTTYGIPAIIERLNIGGRIRNTIAQQDMSAFHAMIQEISSQHLCAIQVLGFFLGGIAGILLVLVR